MTIDYDVYCWIEQYKKSYLMTRVSADNSTAAFKEARKLLSKVHSSCIRVERVEHDSTQDQTP